MKKTTYPYLRLSVTDQCNFNCFYCRPTLRASLWTQKERLTFGEFTLLVEALCRYGVRHVRLTGGEPLLKENLSSFIKDLSSLPQLECLSLTTNGYHLSNFLQGDKEDGIDKINISLDTLNAKRFIDLTGVDALERVREGIFRAQKKGIKKVKLNVVLIRGFNDDEISDFVDFGLRHQLDVRFIEYFPTRSKSEIFHGRFIPTSVVFAAIEERFGRLEPLGKDRLSGPAQYFRIGKESSRIGFISSVTGFFCDDCNRIRLTCDGKLYPCLHSQEHTDLKRPLREGDKKGIFRLIAHALSNKKHYNKIICNRAFEMSEIGG